jgi:signal transduction histidine kinase/ActR/RegA family two-component response regulator
VQSSFARDVDGRKSYKVSFSKYASLNDEAELNENYYYEWIQYLSKFINWNFEVVDVDKSFNEQLDALKDGTIDMIPALERTPERESKFIFSNMSVGKNMFFVVKNKENTDISKGVYQTYRNKKIGLIEGSTVNSYFFSFASDMGFFIPELDAQAISEAKNSGAIEQDDALMKGVVWFDNLQDLTQSLLDGEIDMCLLPSYNSTLDYDILDTVEGGNLYVALRKGLEDQIPYIDSAIKSLNKYYPTLINELSIKYKIIPTDDEFTLEEQAYLTYLKENNITINALVLPDFFPFVDATDEGDIISSIAAFIADKAGMNINIIYSTDMIDYYNKLASDDIDLSFMYDKDETAVEFVEMKKTLPYYISDVVKLTSKTNYNVRTIGIVNDAPLRDRYYEHLDFEPIRFDTKKEAVEAIKKGLVDCVFMTSEEASYWMSQDYANKLVQSSIATPPIRFSIGVKKTSDIELFSILNKVIYSVDQNAVNNLVNSYMLQFKDESHSVKRFVYNNPLAILVIIAVLFLFVLTYINFRNKVKQEKVANDYNKQLEDSLQNEKKASNAKNDFIAKMSHDMRTPMNTIIGLSILGQDEEDDGTKQKYFEQIGESGNYLLSLVNDVLNMQRLNWGEIELKRSNVDFKKLIDSIFTIVSSRARDKHISLKMNDNVSKDYSCLYFDRMRVEQILINIINNAVKYTPDYGVVTVDVNYKKDIIEKDGKNKNLFEKGILVDGEKGDILFVTFDICDNGVGISKEFIPKLFAPFTQEESKLSTNEGGAGLGLAIVKGLIDPMGGIIDVDSTLGVGTQFHVTIPFAISHSMQKNDENLNEIDLILDGKRALLLEDIAINEMITTKLLNNKNIDVDGAENGEVGLSLYLDKPPFTYDFILMDVRMPVMNGLDATKAIRESGRDDAKTIPIIALSANAMKDDIDQSIKAGMNDHIAKPIVPEYMYKTIAVQLTKDGHEEV